MNNKPHSAETKAKMSAARKGRKHSEETKEKLRQIRLAYNPFKGKKHSEESKAKMRATGNPQWAKGENAVNWKGGRTIDKHGYVLIYMPDHSDAVGNYILEHRLVMEQSIGRRLLAIEHVHHRNHIKDDNRIDNLELLPIGEHARHHRLEEIASGLGTTFSRSKKRK